MTRFVRALFVAATLVALSAVPALATHTHVMSSVRQSWHWQSPERCAAIRAFRGGYARRAWSSPC